ALTPPQSVQRVVLFVRPEPSRLSYTSLEEAIFEMRTRMELATGKYTEIFAKDKGRLEMLRVDLQLYLDWITGFLAKEFPLGNSLGEGEKLIERQVKSACVDFSAAVKFVNERIVGLGD